MTASIDYFEALRGAPEPAPAEEASLLQWLDQSVQAPAPVGPVLAMLDTDEVPLLPLPQPNIAPVEPVTAQKLGVNLAPG